MPSDEQARIDEACDRFEAECKAGGNPLIEDFLDDFSDPAREELLRELLFIDHEYRRRTGDPPEQGEYQARFPEQTELISVVLDAARAKTLAGQAMGTIHVGKGRPTADQSENGKQASELTKHSAAASDTQAGTLPEALLAEDCDDLPPARLGDYELLEEIGRGGMGVVFKARQKSVDRTVAVKILRRDKLADLPPEHRDTMIERFRTESLSAAQLQHDNIVQVFEVGEQGGQHFYSMRYVEGESLADLIRQHPLESKHAAELMEPVARALEEAHQLGILHRDIKPRNIIVDDRTGRPLLADFGLAKMLSGDTDVTATGDVMGSPPYMSPEQAKDAARVDKRADIYSLGATLYHLVVGRPPFQAASVAETLRQVWFEDVIPPRQINPVIDADLETIILKSLEKEPQRRFQSSAELADELRRFARGEPILSRPISSFGHFRRWCRRNPMVATLSGVVALLLVSVAALFAAGYFQQSRQLARETQLRTAADAQRRVAEDAKEDAVKHLRLAQGAVDEFTDLAIKDPRLRQHGLDSLRRDFLHATRQYYDRFVQQIPGDAQLDIQRGKAYSQLAGIEADLGRPEEAIKLYEEAVKVFRGLKTKQPDNPEHLHREADAMLSLAAARGDIAQYAAARQILDRAFALCEELVEQSPDKVDYQNLLAHAHAQLALIHKQEKAASLAEKHWNEAIRLRGGIAHRRRGDPANLDELAKCHNNLALLFTNTGRPDEAIEEFSAAMDLWQQLSQEHGDDSSYAAGLATCQYNLGMLYLNTGSPDEAMPLLLGSLRLRSQLVDKHPDVPSYKDELATSYDGVGRLYQQQDLLDEAGDAYYQGLQLREDLRNRFAGVPQYSENLVAGYLNLGVLYNQRGAFDQAAAKFRLAEDVLRSMLAESEDTPRLLHHRAGIQNNLAVVLRQAKHLDEAVEHALAAVEAYRRLAESEGAAVEAQVELAEAYDLLGAIQLARQQYELAEQAFSKAVAARTEIDNAVQTRDSTLAVEAAKVAQAGALGPDGDLAASLKLLDSAVSAAEMILLAADSEPQPMAESLLVKSLLLKARLLTEREKHAEAVEPWTKLSEFASAESRPLYGLRRSVSLARSGDHAQAEESAQRIIEANSEQPQLLYQGACVLSRCAEAVERDKAVSPEDARNLSSQYLNQAVALLTALRKRGLLNSVDAVEEIESDPDLARLRKFPDYESIFGVEP